MDGSTIWVISPHVDTRKLIGLNLVLDGIGDAINGCLGCVAGTNYGENNSLMAITRNYSGPALIAAGVIAILLGFVGKLAGLVGTVPQAVTGGLAIYLFGVIGIQGIAIIQEKRVNLFDPRQLAIGAVITTVAIGGQIIGGREAKSSVGSTTVSIAVLCAVGFLGYLLAEGVDIDWKLTGATCIGAVMIAPLAASTSTLNSFPFSVIRSIS